MKFKIITTIVLILALGKAGCQNDTKQKEKTNMNQHINKSEEEWKQQLGSERYYILREKGTEKPHTGKYNMHFEKGIYTCGGCGAELFTSEQKFDGHCGWPSFDNEIGSGDRIKKIKDYSHGMIRTEIVCAACGGHLGHVFDDGPTQTGLRYCVNSLSIDFKPAEKNSTK